MATEPINPTARNLLQSLRTGPAKGSSGEPVHPQADPGSTPRDKVSLSPEAKQALAGAQDAGRGNRANPAANSGEGFAADQFRKLSLTDNNQVVLKIVDGQTQKVVRQIPPEEAVELRQAIQDGIQNIIDNNSTEQTE